MISHTGPNLLLCSTLWLHATGLESPWWSPHDLSLRAAAGRGFRGTRGTMNSPWLPLQQHTHTHPSYSNLRCQVSLVNWCIQVAGVKLCYVVSSSITHLTWLFCLKKKQKKKQQKKVFSAKKKKSSGI